MAIKNAMPSILIVAPVRENGLKYTSALCRQVSRCRSRKGAWIEIGRALTMSWTRQVAPVRERGLKFNSRRNYFIDTIVAPVREGGLKWQGRYGMGRTGVAPVRERGLKCRKGHRVYCTSQQILDTNHKKIYNKNSLLFRYPFVMQLAILSWRQIV